MEHWRHAFVCRRVSLSAFLAACWANLVELRIALSIRRELSRLRLLLSIDAASEHLDDEAGYYAFVVLLERYVRQEWAYASLLHLGLPG